MRGLLEPREKETNMNEQHVRIWKEANVLSPIHLVESNTERNSIRILRSPVEFRNDLLLVHNVITRLPFLFSFFLSFFFFGGGGVFFVKRFLSLSLPINIYIYI